MKKYSALLIFHLSLITFCDAQNPLVKQWDYRFGGTVNDNFTCYQQTADGGFILGGVSYSGISGDKTQNIWGGSDYWIIKIDSLGSKEWDKNFGGTNDDVLYSLQQTTDGGYILGGQSNSGISGDKTQNTWGNWDYWIVKIDSLGNKQWDKDFGGTNYDVLYSLLQTADGGYILGGESRSGISGDKTQSTWGYDDYWIVKIDSLGNKQWDKDFGGTSVDVLLSLQQTPDGGYILGGGSQSGIGGDKTQANWGGYDYWIVKIDSLGNKQWDKDFGGTSSDLLQSLKQTADAGYILGGYSASNISGDKTQASWGWIDYWIVKIDSVGNKQWDKDYGGADMEEFYSIQQTADNGYLISGDSYSPISGDKTEANLGYEQIWILKTDSLGNKIWDKTMFTPGHDETGLAIQTKDGCFAIASCSDGGVGGYKTQPSWGDYDYWIIKFCDTTSLAVPTVAISSSDTTMCEKQCINFFDLSQNAPTSWQWYFPGASPDTSTQQNPTNICYNLYGNYNVTLVACNAAGCDSVFFPAFINVLPTPPAPVITVSNDTIFASGPYSFAWYEVSNPGIVLSTDSFLVFTTGSYYVIATDSNGCNVVSNVVNTGLQSLSSEPFIITPNPASDELTISYAQHDKATIHIMNILGETLLSSEIKTENTKLNISSLPNGIYFLQFNSAGRNWNSRFVVQR